MEISSELILAKCEKIELKQRDTEIKLKSEREVKTVAANIKISIKDTLAEINKYTIELEKLKKNNQELQSELVIEKIKHEALVVQEDICKKYLAELKKKLDQNLSELWEIRSTICENIRQTSDEYDIPALLNRPVTHESQQNTKSTSPENKPPETTGTRLYERRLKEAIARREKAIAERDRLLVEPDTDAKFLRIKTALDKLNRKLENLMKSRYD